MILRCLILIGSLAFVSGCNMQTGISPVEAVIKNSSDRDFGFEGTWVPLPNTGIPHENAESHEMIIKRDGSYTATLIDGSRKNDDDDDGDEFVIEFRTHELSTKHPHAIVEIELMRNDKIEHRRLAISAVIDDRLHLWTIDGRKAGELMYEEGVCAVIEHFTFSTTVRCDPKKLLEFLAKHCAELSGDEQVFRRKPKIGR